MGPGHPLGACGGPELRGAGLPDPVWPGWLLAAGLFPRSRGLDAGVRAARVEETRPFRPPLLTSYAGHGLETFKKCS